LTPYDYGQSLIYALKSGKINFAFTDLARAQSSTNMGSSPIQIPLTNLVYLGLNNTLGYTATSSFRKAIALCLDRSRIASDAFLSRATASSTPFNPNMYATAELENQLYADPDAANSILDALGYNERDDEGYRLHGVDRLTLSVLVNTENFYRTQTARVVKDNLAAIGVDCAITELSSKNFLAAVQSSEFEMYIGETRLYANNDLSEFFSSGGALSYGGVANSGMPYASLREGQIGYTYFCSTFFEQSPFIPLVFRNGVACFTETMSYNVKSSMSDPFFNIENWTYAQ
ncbi:MAG: ABC transporter substrate-binding protein, partial [Acetanaerobacterium sp.]